MVELQDTTALVIGVNGLGAAAAHALAAAGVGHLLLLDDALASPADLVANPLLPETSVGQPRAERAAASLRRLFPEQEVVALVQPLEEALGAGLLRRAQVVVEVASRFPAMFLVNDAAAAARVPVVHGALITFTAHLLTFVPGESGCLRCLFEGPPPPTDPAAPDPEPLGPLAGFVGGLLGVEAVRLLEGRPGAYAGQLLAYEARSGWSRQIPVDARPGCAGCAVAAPPVGAAPASEGAP